MDKELQKNMLLAIALSIVIMLIWQHFFAPKQPEQVQQQEQAAENIYHERPEPAAPTASTTGFETATTQVPPVELAKALDVAVSTPHVTATFTTLGARLTSLVLPEYQSKRGGHVELVPQDADMGWPLALGFNDTGFGTSTDSFVYEHKLYEPSGADLSDLTRELPACLSNAAPETPENEIRQRLDSCLPKLEATDDLRTAVIAHAAGKFAAAGSATNLAEMISKSTVLVFSRQLNPELKLYKAFVFDSGNYSFDMYVAFRNTGSQPLDLGRGRASYSINWVPGLESSETSAKGDQLVGVYLVEKDFGQKAIRKLKEAMVFPDKLTWIGLKRSYFFVAFAPTGGLVDASIKPLVQKGDRVSITFDMRPIKLEPGGIAADNIRILAGPMLKEVLESLGSEFDRILNFGFFDIFGKFLLAALILFDKYVQSYGLAIILLTLVVRLGLFPLNQKSYKSMKQMQSLQPMMNDLREKYKKNPQEMNKKMMELYRTHKVNPMGGCLPIAFQMPILIALFQALRYAVELRGASFLWISDLSEPDRLFTLTAPFRLSINLLPLLVIAAMVIQQRMTPMPSGAQNESQKLMMQLMPIIFGLMFYSMPSGLTVYFLVSTVLGLAQQYFVQKSA
ncbi:membrane protein insertase YidC [Candidatus Poribacteria bacterium]|nr:membrane protein insertase YidC [Candidatus Poribacteria bacterium]